MLNYNQRATIAIGAIVAALMILFPPYFDTGGLFGGVRLAFLLLPPHPDPSIDYRPTLAAETLLHELCALACFTIAAAVSAASGTSRSSKGLVLGWGIIAAGFFAGSAAFSFTSPGRGWTSPPFLFCLIPLQYPGGCYVFCLRLAIFGFCCLTSVLLACPQLNESKLVRTGWIAVATTLIIVGASAYRAAGR